jgi:parallel beta-helix repeat protein
MLTYSYLKRVLNMVTTAKTAQFGHRPFMKRFALCIAIAFSFCLLAANSTVTAATYYVDNTNGNDTYDGNEVKPWKTLDRAYTWYSGEGNKVQEGDTVYFKNGGYGTFRENTQDGAWNTYYMTRSNWITYKAATGHTPEINNINVANGDRRSPPLVPNGNSYLIFDGFKIDNAAKFLHTNYVQVKNCTVTTGAETVSGYFAPYFSRSYDNAVFFSDVNYATIQNNTITNAYRPIFVQYPANHTTISGNTCHHTGYGITVSGCNDVTVEDNYLYDMDNRRISAIFTGTVSGTFTPGDLVTQSVEPGFTGVVDIVSGSNIYIYVASGTLPHRHSDDGGAGTITDVTTGATLTSITNVDPEHSDGIEVAAANSNYYPKNIIVRRNKIIFVYPPVWAQCGGGIKTGCQRPAYQQNVLIENNLVVGAQPTKFWSMRDVNVNNNVFYGGTSKIYITNNGGDEIIDNMYNNIFSSLSIDADLDGYSIYIKNHGNNIFGTNFSDAYTGGPSHPFAVNGTELANYSIASLFVNAANNDFNLAAGSIAINFGNASYAPAKDILGKSRVGAPDAGCYEYISSTIHSQSDSNNPPNADAGPDRTITNSDQSGSEQVTLDGSGSSGNIADSNYVWTWTTKDGNKSATGIQPTVSLPVGRYIITLKVTDNSDLNDIDTVVITVEVEEGLVGHWKFEDGSGLYANDSSGYGITGRLLNGPLWTTQGEISFDGNNDAVEINTATLNISSGTVALWVNPRGFSKSKHYLFGHLTQPANNRIQLFCNALGTLGVGLGDNASINTNIQTLNTQEWYHIALTWSNTAYAVFVDGQQKASGTFSGISNMQTYADIGNSGNRSKLSEAFYGLIDEVRLYNRALSADEVANHALVFLPIGNKTIGEGELLTFPVKTKFGTIVEISDSNLPYIPSFTSNVFTWTPDYDDAGTYEVEFTAPHGSGEDFERITVTVTDTQQQEPVGNWKFNELSGDIASDSSLTGNTGYLQNGLAWSSGIHNGAITFSVPNDAVEIQTTKLNPQYGTIAMWVYMDKQTLSRHYLFGHASPILTNRIQLYLKYGNLCLGLGNSHETCMNIQQLQTQQWYHIALAWSGGTYNVYVDGVLKATGTYTGLTGLADHADIGNNGVTRDKGLNGSIDDVVIYNRALNADEIAQLATN